MLDTQTKTRIDSARDILVGKVPDPKSQVEQITIALIYKFMDDMDRQSEELGGKAAFFTGNFKKYRWAQLLDKRYSGHERLLLYAEGIEKMNENKNIPQLFRDIFKGVFLPYRDPETLNLFLKEIDGFSYDHSERLGDAFEYLLSVLGTQGDAGQFRTPRHIIDFIVAVVDPKKTETILDPACGTAGFLISAFKHIQKGNKNLTPDERARLMTNFRGYDIAPDMVRLARANMYLHRFPRPTIYEYDTLTSEERWDERFDVILANPPFMTPKGGIRPHNRFTIKAKRSEVLFVDYIAEHLNPGGRAGIIVPEGIIFQSQNAYKNLRKMLLEDYLWAVVSLPAGVFNPYSGVKTSILFLDRNMVKRRNEALFVKIENDGFELGAQRRPIEGSQLAEALAILNDNRKSQESKLALTVPRKRLLESPDINLTGDRYRAPTIRANGKWPMVKLGEVCALLGGGTPSKTKKQFWNDGTVKWISAKHINEHGAVVGWELITQKAVESSATTIIPQHAVVVVTRVSVGKMTLLDEPMAINQDLTGCVVKDETQLNACFLLWVLKGYARHIEKSAQGLGVRGVTRRFMAALQIPLPPLDEQERIVAEVEGYRKIIEGARQIIASYKPTVRINPKWPTVKLGEVCEVNPKDKTLGNINPETVVSFLPMADVHAEEVIIRPSQTRMLKEVIKGYTAFRKNDVLMAKITPCFENGKAGVVKSVTGGLGFGSTEFIVIRPNAKRLLVPLLLCYLSSIEFRNAGVRNMTGSAGQQRVTTDFVRSYEIPLPPIATQRRIVAELEEERKLVEANRELIERMEAKIKAKLAEVWGEQ